MGRRSSKRARSPGTRHHSVGSSAAGCNDGDDPEVIGKWIEQSGDADLIEAAGDSWIEPRETLSEYSYVRGATHQVAVESDHVKNPAGLAASDTSLFVADSASGVISEYS